MNVQRNKNWNEQLVTEEIRAWQELGKPLYSHYMRQNYQELLAAGIRYFGTWRAAIEASGIPYDSVRKYRDWSKERIVETIQRLEKDGVDLSFTKDALIAIAVKAQGRKTGARGLRSILEEVMLDVMYGMIPRANRVRRRRLPPENRSTKPSSDPPLRLKASSSFMKLPPGVGRWPPSRYTASIARVNRTRFRKSGMRKIFASLSKSGNAPCSAITARPQSCRLLW